MRLEAIVLMAGEEPGRNVDEISKHHRAQATAHAYEHSEHQ
jgi:hypothetical protein